MRGALLRSLVRVGFSFEEALFIYHEQVSRPCLEDEYDYGALPSNEEANSHSTTKESPTIWGRE